MYRPMVKGLAVLENEYITWIGIQSGFLVNIQIGLLLHPNHPRRIGLTRVELSPHPGMPCGEAFSPQIDYSVSSSFNSRFHFVKTGGVLGILRPHFSFSSRFLLTASF